jgi:hypothetical protein
MSGVVFFVLFRFVDTNVLAPPALAGTAIQKLQYRKNAKKIDLKIIKY